MFHESHAKQAVASYELPEDHEKKISELSHSTFSNIWILSDEVTLNIQHCSPTLNYAFNIQFTKMSSVISYHKQECLLNIF